MLTDSNNSDTDGDGFNDEEDSFPTVPFPKVEPPPSVDLMTAFFTEVFRGAKISPLVVGTGTTALEQFGRPAPIAAERIVFVKGNRSDFVGVRTSKRIIVLTEAEAERASKERGLLYPMQIETVIDERGENAFIVWSERWRGGSYEAYKAKGVWILLIKDEWIT